MEERRYDVFKSSLIRMKVMEDGLGLHFTSSFLAVSSRSYYGSTHGVADAYRERRGL